MAVVVTPRPGYDVMRIVVDANVFISAAIQHGPSHRIVEAWLEDNAFALIVCPALLREIDGCIISGDKDLLDWPEQRPPVLTPRAFAQQFG